MDITAIILAYKGAPTGNSMAMGFKQLEKLKVIPSDLSEKLQKAVGFRNISVHECNTIDWSIVYDVIHNHLDNFKQFMECVLNL